MLTPGDLQEIGKLILSSEKRISQNVDEKLSDFKVEIGQKIIQLSTDIGDYFSEVVFPMVAEKADKSDIVRLERKIDRIVLKDEEQDFRLDKLELEYSLGT